MGIRIIAIQRDRCYCPNGPQADEAMLKAVISCLHDEVTMVEERQLSPDLPLLLDSHHINTILSMGRMPETLTILKDCQTKGIRVINRPEAVERCTRSIIHRIMQDCDVPMPKEGMVGFWLKRGDANAHEHGDVVFCKDSCQLEEAKMSFLHRGITQWIVSPHVEGTNLKFYAVGHRFFRCFPVGLLSNQRHKELHEAVVKVAEAIGIDIYGGDCIVDKQGDFYLIDFNDWPSFAPCRDEAAEAIVHVISSEWQTAASTLPET